jgi:hypothetical protein
MMNQRQAKSSSAYDKINIMGDVINILRPPISASGSKWCTLKDTPCIPDQSCEEHIEDGKCSYESDDNDVA